MLSGINKRERIDVEHIDREMILMITPKVYGGREGEEVRRMKAFTNNALIVEQTLNVSAKELTVREFLQAVEIVKKQRK